MKLPKDKQTPGKA